VPFAYDAQLMAGARAMMADGVLARPQPAPRDDWKALRANIEHSLSIMDARTPERADVTRMDHRIRSYDGAEVVARWYVPTGGGDGSAAVFLHGGGMIAGTVALHDRLIAGYAGDSGVPLLAVDYRRAPEDPHPAPVEDCYAGLAWLTEHAAELGVDAGRIAVMGESGGGGLAAGTALLARDRSLPVARQILVYPMLDDRTTTDDPALAPFLGWSADDNYTGWHALLGDAAGGPEVSSYAAPARASDLSGLPPSYVEVGELDLFRDESVDYARRIAAAGASVELHVHPGCPHGFELIAPDSAVARRARADRLRVLKGF
jgi:acetyl esterase/lipase